jgi:uncharacterized protein YdaU (DUF1376 family)
MTTKQRRDAWFPFYPGDYLRDTSRLTTEQHGAYLLLILDYWVKGPLPDDDAALAAVTRLSAPTWRKTRPLLVTFFSVSDGKWNHKRIDHERMKAFAITELRAEAGRDGADRRWQKHGKRMANATAELMANGHQTPSQSDAPSHPPIKPKTESGSARDPLPPQGAGSHRASSGSGKMSEFAKGILRNTLQAKAET